MKDDLRAVCAALLLAVPVLALAQPQPQAKADAERCTAASGSVDETISACTRAFESKQFSDANVAILLNSRGISWREKGYDEMALADFDEAIRLDPKNPTAYVSRGNLYGDKGDHDRAIADYDRALKINPRLAPAYGNRAVTWLAKRDTDKALADLNEALRLDPKMMDAYNTRGFLWRARGDLGRAIEDFGQAVKLEPKFADGYDSLALIYATAADAKFRNGKLAVENARRACELTGWKNPYYLNTLAAAHAEAGDFKQAAEWQEKALAMRGFSKQGEAMARERLALYRAGKPFREPAGR